MLLDLLVVEVRYYWIKEIRSFGMNEGSPHSIKDAGNIVSKNHTHEFFHSGLSHSGIAWGQYEKSLLFSIYLP